MPREDAVLPIGDGELVETFIRASGPGGQNVNKVASAVQLRFNVDASPSLSAAVKRRLKLLAGRRLNAVGEIVIEARRFRTQEQNRADARNRLAALIHQAKKPPVKRHKTRVPLSQKKKRLENKKRRSETKARRARPVI